MKHLVLFLVLLLVAGCAQQREDTSVADATKFTYGAGGGGAGTSFTSPTLSNPTMTGTATMAKAVISGDLDVGDTAIISNDLTIADDLVFSGVGSAISNSSANGVIFSDTIGCAGITSTGPIVATGANALTFSGADATIGMTDAYTANAVGKWEFADTITTDTDRTKTRMVYKWFETDDAAVGSTSVDTMAQWTIPTGYLGVGSTIWVYGFLSHPGKTGTYDVEVEFYDGTNRVEFIDDLNNANTEGSFSINKVAIIESATNWVSNLSGAAGLYMGGSSNALTTGTIDLASYLRVTIRGNPDTQYDTLTLEAAWLEVTP